MAETKKTFPWENIEKKSFLMTIFKSFATRSLKYIRGDLFGNMPSYQIQVPLDFCMACNLQELGLHFEVSCKFLWWYCFEGSLNLRLFWDKDAWLGSSCGI